MPSSRPVSPSPLAVIASGAVVLLGAAIAHAETAADAHLRQLAGQAASCAGEVQSLLAKGAVETMAALLDAGGNQNAQLAHGDACIVSRGSDSEPVRCWHCDDTGHVYLAASPAP